MKFTKKGVAISVIVLGGSWGLAAAVGTLNYGVMLMSVLIVIAFSLLFRNKKSSESLDLSNFQDEEEDEELGSRFDRLVDDVRDWGERYGKYSLYYDRSSSIFKTYEIPDIQSEKHLMASVIMRDEQTGDDIHIALEITTGTIVQHGRVQIDEEYVWPQDYVSLYESRLEGNQMRNQKSLNQTLRQLAMNNGQLDGNYSKLVVDQDETVDPAMDVDGETT